MGKRNRTPHTNYRKLWQSSDDRDVLGKRDDGKEATDPGRAMAVCDTPDNIPDYRQVWQQNLPAAPAPMASGVVAGGCLNDVTFDREDFTREGPQKPDHGKGKWTVPPEGGYF